MKWQGHVNKICKSISRNIFLLSKLKPFIDTDARKIFYNAQIKSHIDYASTIWDGSSHVHLKELNSLHRRAAKHILPDKTLTTDQKLKKLQILPLDQHLLFNKGVVMFKVWNKSVPDYLSVLFKRQETRYPTSRLNFNIPLPRIDIYKTSLSFSGPSFWNTLPSSIKSVGTISSFKANLQKHLLTNCSDH